MLASCPAKLYRTIVMYIFEFLFHLQYFHIYFSALFLVMLYYYKEMDSSCWSVGNLHPGDVIGPSVFMPWQMRGGAAV